MKNILVIDDHEVLRDGVKRVFDKQTDSVTFGEASTLLEALKLVREQEWDIVVLDISLGDRRGLEVLKELKQVRPRLPVLILSMHSEEQFARRAFKAGASGYITKDSPRAELVKAVNKVMSGGRYLSAAFVEKFIFDLDISTAAPPHQIPPTPDSEIPLLSSSRKTLSEIASMLALSD